MSCCSSSPQIMPHQQDCYITVTLVEQSSVSSRPCWHHPPSGTAGRCLPEQGLCTQHAAVGPALQPAHCVLSSAHWGVQDRHVQWDRAKLTEECRIAISSGTEQCSLRSAGSLCRECIVPTSAFKDAFVTAVERWWVGEASVPITRQTLLP